MSSSPLTKRDKLRGQKARQITTQTLRPQASGQLRGKDFLKEFGYSLATEAPKKLEKCKARQVPLFCDPDSE